MNLAEKFGFHLRIEEFHCFSNPAVLLDVEGADCLSRAVDHSLIKIEWVKAESPNPVSLMGHGADLGGLPISHNKNILGLDWSRSGLVVIHVLRRLVKRIEYITHLRHVDDAGYKSVKKFNNAHDLSFQ